MAHVYMDEVKQGETNSEQPTQSMYEQVKAERERLDKLLPELKAQVATLQELRAREMLGGQTAGGPSPQKQVENPKEYAKRVLSGKL